MTSRHRDFERLRDFIRDTGAEPCVKFSGHCRCLACLLDEIETDVVLTVDEAGALYHHFTRTHVSAVTEPVLYALAQRISGRVAAHERVKPQPFAWRVP